MGGQANEATGPNFREGLPVGELSEGGHTLGHLDGDPVLVVRRGEQTFAVGATCSHYGGPLAEGWIEGDTVRCPWHHACFSLRTGEALGAPALNPIDCFNVEERDGKLYVLSKKPIPQKKRADRTPENIVVVGGGAAAQAASEMLRREGFAGRLTLISHDAAPPVDRPNLSKDYLAGTAPEEWIPLRPPEFYAEQGIELVLGSRVSGIDVGRKEVTTQEGRVIPFDAMLLATGAEPRKLAIPGADLPHVFYLRSLADSRAIIERAKSARRAVVVGASFIGLEVAAALRARDINVQVVAPDRRPLERIMGPQIGDFVRALHESHGVVFHLGQTPVTIDSSSVMLPSASLAADLVIVGVGVKPRIELAEQAGLAIDRGVVVNEYLESSVPGIFAAGDIARWPDRYTGESIRVEHWVVAQRQGQVAAKNMLGQKVPYAAVPFFWSQHYDVRISYVGHAESWDKLDLGGDVARREFTVSLRDGSKTKAVITVGRDLESLAAEVALERGDAKALEAFGSK